MKPVLLLIPGMLNDARVWAPVRAALDGAAECRIADVARGNSIAEMAQQAWALLADIEPHCRLVIAGFSMGGHIALQMLAEPQRRVDALALIATSARAESAEGRATREKTIAAIERDFAKAMQGLLIFATGVPYQADAAAMAGLRTMLLDIGAATAVRQHHALLQRKDQRETVRSLRLPTAVLAGNEDRSVPVELAQELAALIPGAHLQRLAGCGHMVPLERPLQVAQALRTLLIAQETR